MLEIFGPLASNIAHSASSIAHKNPATRNVDVFIGHNVRLQNTSPPHTHTHKLIIHIQFSQNSHFGIFIDFQQKFLISNIRAMSLCDATDFHALQKKKKYTHVYKFPSSVFSLTAFFCVFVPSPPWRFPDSMYFFLKSAKKKIVDISDIFSRRSGLRIEIFSIFQYSHFSFVEWHVSSAFFALFLRTKKEKKWAWVYLRLSHSCCYTYTTLRGCSVFGFVHAKCMWFSNWETLRNLISSPWYSFC